MFFFSGLEVPWFFLCNSHGWPVGFICWNAESPWKLGLWPGQHLGFKASKMFFKQTKQGKKSFCRLSVGWNMLKLVLSDMINVGVSIRIVFSTGWPGWSQFGSIPCPYWIPRKPGRKYGICIMIYSLQLGAQSWQANWVFGMGIIWRTPSCPGDLPLQSRKFEGLWHHVLGWTKQIEPMTPLIFAGLISATAFCSVDQSICSLQSLEPVPEQTTWYPLHKQKPQ